MTRAPIALVFALVSLAAPARAQGALGPNLVTNGAFQTGDLSGFSTAGDVRYHLATNPLLGSPEAFAISSAPGFPSPSLLTQTITGAAANTLYTLGFDVIGYGGGGTTNFFVDVLLGGVRVVQGHYVYGVQALDSYEVHGFTYTVLSGPQTPTDLTFSFANSGTAGVGRILLVAVAPEPTTFVLLGTGLLGVLGLARRRHA